MAYRLFKLAAPAQRGVIPFYEVFSKVKDKIETGGSIQLDDAWKECKNSYCYGLVAMYFKILMEQLVARGLASRLKRKYILVDNILVDAKEVESHYIKEAMKKKSKKTTALHLLNSRSGEAVKAEPPSPAGRLTKFSAQDDGKRRVGPFYSKVYGQNINE